MDLYMALVSSRSWRLRFFKLPHIFGLVVFI
nr:MAG TPA: hypothetical protein [Microviridae sp.]